MRTRYYRWSKFEDRILRDLWLDYQPARIIGERLDRSKNAVIGRVHRLGLRRS